MIDLSSLPIIGSIVSVLKDITSKKTATQTVTTNNTPSITNAPTNNNNNTGTVTIGNIGNIENKS